MKVKRNIMKLLERIVSYVVLKNMEWVIIFLMALMLMLASLYIPGEFTSRMLLSMGLVIGIMAVLAGIERLG